MTAGFIERLTADVATARRDGLLRTLESRECAQQSVITIDGRTLVNFTSNDYLGLASDARVMTRVREELPRQGFGAGAAALLSGRCDLHGELEARIAAWCGADAALLFSSGYLANSGALPALIGRPDVVVHDRLNHASLIDGVLASGARHRRYPHLASETIEPLFAANPGRERFIVTESVFSMDGDVAPLAELSRIAHESAAVLYVDDAHGFGVIGAGRGAAASLELRDDAGPTTILMLTFGKALGSVGAAVLGPHAVIEYLVQRARTFVYDTALPAVCAAAALEALDIVINDPAPSQRLTSNIAFFRNRAAQAGIDVLPSTTPIQPLPLGDDERAVALASALADAGFYVRAIRPPTVPRGTSRLRITLTANHTTEQIIALLGALSELVRR